MEISKARELKKEMEEEIGKLLLYFELSTGLKVGVIFRDRIENDKGETEGFKINIPINF